MATYQFIGRISTIELKESTDNSADETYEVSFISDNVIYWNNQYFNMACVKGEENIFSSLKQIPDPFSVDKTKYNLLRQNSDDKFKIEYEDTSNTITKIWLIK